MNTLFTDILLQRYAPGLVMAAHVHRRASLSLVLGGSYEECIRGRRGEFEFGALLVCPPDERHAQRFGAAGVRKLVFTPTPEAIARLEEAVRFADAPAVRTLGLAEVGRRIAKELQTADDFSNLVVSGLSHELIGLAAREQARRGGTLPVAVQRAMALLRDNVQQPLALHDVARAVGCDAGELARSFRACLGETPGDMHRRLRVERAAELVIRSAQPLADIAALCGFSDQPHMTRAFKALLGTTPAAYRRQARG
ncbi:helix-turn-helix domain-containing protein [Aquabacterium sp.]|uniref:AraC family transcriptional regulator n=1 Tax=Aquabacterium sp. TaxID=1872578 RepID=UPI0037851FD2